MKEPSYSFPAIPSVTKKDFERELEKWGSYVADICDGNCKTCGLHQPHKKVTCRGTELAQELERKIQGFN